MAYPTRFERVTFALGGHQPIYSRSTGTAKMSPTPRSVWMMEVEKRDPREKITYRSNPLPNNIAMDLRVLAEQPEPPLCIVAIRSVSNQRAV